jgi:hypothetical protein
MRRFLLLFSIFLLLLVGLLAYSYHTAPEYTIQQVYEKIPQGLKENSQLISAYYSSQNGDKEYQFALYNPENNTITIYTFKVYKFLKIWPTTRKIKITCRTPFNYSLLSTSPEKLKDFTNCDNCRELLYRDRVYRNEDIESIYPSVSGIIQSDKEYWRIEVIGASEVSTGEVRGFSGDTVESYGLSGYSGLLVLPTIRKPDTGIIITVSPLDSTHETVYVYYPGNVTFRLTEKHPSLRDVHPWLGENITQVLKKLESFGFTSQPWRWETTLSAEYSGVAWVSLEGKYYRYRFYPDERWVCTGLNIGRVKISCRGAWGFWNYGSAYLFP